MEHLIERLRLHDDDRLYAEADRLMSEAADALQSQAERIAELERESDTQAKAYGLAVVERDTLRHELKVAQEGWRCECSTDDALRAELEAITATEPVGVLRSDEIDGHVFEPTNGWPFGPLFTRPMPAESNAELVEALESIIAMENTESNEWDAVERVIPEMCDTARNALSKYKGAK